MLREKNGLPSIQLHCNITTKITGYSIDIDVYRNQNKSVIYNTPIKYLDGNKLKKLFLHKIIIAKWHR